MLSWAGLLLLGLLGSAEAGQFHVAPTGRPGGNGSRNDPWDLQTALNQPAAVRPGDTLWLHGGLYSGTFRSNLNGTQSQPIIVRQYPGERAILDNVAGVKEFGLYISGSYTWFWGFEVRNTSSSIWNISGVAMGGPGQKLINMIIHDNLATGVTSFSAAADGEVYGCLIYFNGRETEDQTNRGYGIYTQNNVGRVKPFKENIIPFSWGFGLHAYTAGNKIDDFLFEGNVIYNSGILWRGSQYERNFFIGSDDTSVVAADNIFRNNHSYYPATPSAGARNTFGYFGGTRNLVLTGNWFVGGAFDVSGTNPTITGNTFYRTNGFSGSGNTYLTSPSGTNIFVRPNAYEGGRANIIIYNWSRASSVSVDLSAAGLRPGDGFVVRDALNWTGPAVVTGTYTGSSVAIPMTGLSVATPVGTPAVTPTHTAPEFGTFVILPTQSIAAQPQGSLDADPDSLGELGGNVTLSWTSLNAATASIDHGIGSVPLNGSRSVHVPATTLFTLTLSGPGGVATTSARVVVAGPPPPGGPSPREFALEQNFPNPFNPGTTIVVDVPVASEVQLIVFDTLGKEVARLIDGYRAAGRHRVDFTARGIASGVYWYVLRANGSEEARSMLLLR
ncbi:MAG: T9SS type A sorting domain-containing protein [Bacteroidota bacterium]